MGGHAQPSLGPADYCLDDAKQVNPYRGQPANSLANADCKARSDGAGNGKTGVLLTPAGKECQ